MLSVIEPIHREQDQYHRVAARHQLTFHIDKFGYITEHRGWKSETREASYYELEMWQSLCYELPPVEWPPSEIPTLDATPEEFCSSILGDDPFTISSFDVSVIMHMKEFTPCMNRNDLKRGLIGHFNRKLWNTPIYVSRAIPKGYIWCGVIECWQPKSNERELEPDISQHIKSKIDVEIHSLMVHHS